MIKGLADFLLLAHADGDNQRVDDAERCDQRIDKRSHVALCEQRIICRLAQRRQLAVCQRDDRRAGLFEYSSALSVRLE